MDRFIRRHRERIVGVLSCFDRVIFKGHLPISYAAGLERFLDGFGLKLKEFKDFAVGVADRLGQDAKDAAERAGRGYRHLNSVVRKEVLARVLADAHVIAGFRNRHVREALFGIAADGALAKCHVAAVTRLLNRLHAHGYIAKVPRTHRWRATDIGRAAMSAVSDVRENAFPAAFARAAA